MVLTRFSLRTAAAVGALVMAGLAHPAGFSQAGGENVLQDVQQRECLLL